MPPSASPESRPLAKACDGAFTERTRRKARALFAAGQAAVEGVGREMALVSVQDDREAPYRVAIDVEELDMRDRLRVECQCAFFTAGHPCEHVYAALLAIEAAGDNISLISPAATSRRLDVVPHRTGLPLGEDAFFDSEHAFARIDAGGSKSGDWRSRLETLKRSTVLPSKPTLGTIEQLELVLEPTRSENSGAPVLTALAYDSLDGSRAEVALSRRDLERISSDELRQAIEPWLACPPLGQRGAAEVIAPDPGQVPAGTRRVPIGLQRALFEVLDGKLHFGADGPLLKYDKGAAWRLELWVSVQENVLQAEGMLVRADETARGIEEAQLVLRDGWVVLDDKVAAFDVGSSFDWVRQLRKEGSLSTEVEHISEFLTFLAGLPAIPPIHIENDVDGWSIVRVEPQPKLSIGILDQRVRRAKTSLQFIYEDKEVDHAALCAALVDDSNKKLFPRDLISERRWLQQLIASGLESETEDGLVARGGVLADIEQKLVELGARVDREGRALRRAGETRLRLSSGTDWFDLDGEIEFDGMRVQLSAILDALQNKGSRIQLPDGSEGILPEALSRQIGALAGIGKLKQGVLRFNRSQAILLDALLSAQPSVEKDDTFKNLMEAMKGDLVMGPVSNPDGFKGELRSYQQHGLGWLQVLRRIALGGCLADDMGLGKTVQVLALLGEVYRDSTVKRPTLVVAPRSLVFNWKQESERFTPHLRVVEYTGQQRATQIEQLNDVDLILTTYGTVRRDISVLSGLFFEYIVLDEAQTIKNYAAQVSKACRSLQAAHRIAMSGTPVENDVSELWSIFEFLNPRMLGGRRDFVRLANGDALKLVARGLSPLLLRRRKEEVLSELPEKTELTVYCDLSGEERQLYDALRVHYRQEIDDKAAKVGMSGLRTEVLEALLRLRQTSCHPGLVDEEKRSMHSTKVETLIAHLEEVVAEGHKALVFSQFVKLLEIVKIRLDEVGIKYTYLDGQSRDRAGVVDSFQNDTSVQVFLISLRAGGLGLNLTAADYVFILDPWWNPAVEAQAIDRAHRIGQTRPVFAYRYIARGTVEEKILALHRDKRALAEAIVGGERDLGGRLSLEELRLLLQ